MTWNEYYEKFYDWAESTRVKRISSLTDFEASCEVVEIAEQLFDEQAASRLINKALDARVRFTSDEVENLKDFVDEETLCALISSCEEKFTKEQIEELSYYCIDDALLQETAENSGIYTDIEEDEEDDFEVDEAEPAPVKLGFFGTLLAFDFFSRLTKRKKPAGRCDGDCANCPPHYGYRYGRWYYGHGHSHGCERAGNRGGSAAD